MTAALGLPAFLAIGLGAALGAWARYGLSMWLNPQHHALPLGTLAANLLGGLLVGLAVGLLERTPGLDPIWRLAIVTGFLGALTTFSTFSLEAVMMIARGHLAWAVGHSFLHLFGSIAAAAIGLKIVNG